MEKRKTDRYIGTERVREEVRNKIKRKILIIQFRNRRIDVYYMSEMISISVLFYSTIGFKKF